MVTKKKGGGLSFSNTPRRRSVIFYEVWWGGGLQFRLGLGEKPGGERSCQPRFPWALVTVVGRGMTDGEAGGGVHFLTVNPSPQSVGRQDPGKKNCAKKEDEIVPIFAHGVQQKLCHEKLPTKRNEACISCCPPWQIRMILTAKDSVKDLKKEGENHLRR